jgi:hypothetical protein
MEGAPRSRREPGLTTSDFEDPDDLAILIVGDARCGPIIDSIDPELTASAGTRGRSQPCP